MYGFSLINIIHCLNIRAIHKKTKYCIKNSFKVISRPMKTIPVYMGFLFLQGLLQPIYARPTVEFGKFIMYIAEDLINVQNMVCLSKICPGNILHELLSVKICKYGFYSSFVASFLK